MNNIFSTQYFGKIACLLTSFVILMLVFGEIIQSPNTVFFSNGDGLKSTFNSYYHLNYDTAYLHTYSQNYPYGESVYFSDGQSLIINGLKLLKKWKIDLSDYMIGMLNVWMLFSAVIGAYLIYLLLIGIGLPALYSIVVANIIIFLSPQLDRLGGHYTLSYMFFIPLMLYALFTFFKKPTYIKAALMGVFSLFMLETHGYYIAFWGIWLFIFYLFLYFSKHIGFTNAWKNLAFMSIQLIIPYIIYIFYSSPELTDRTLFPWGFPLTRARIEGVFLPLGKPYASFLNIKSPSWEGISFIGLVAAFGFAVILFSNWRKTNFKIRGTKKWYRFTNNNYLNSIYWGAIVALLFSMAVPFNLGLWDTWKFMGPLKQFRAIGRFAWLFYYTINIIVFYSLWQWHVKSKTKLSSLLVIAALLWGAYDAYLFAHNRGNRLNNQKELFTDVNNTLPMNSWVKTVETDSFQAILPLPFYHIGSETYWLGGNHHEMIESSFWVSWKTGLPLMSVMMSRTSISQTLKSLELYFEPLHEFRLVNDLPNSKDILVVHKKTLSLNNNEARLLRYATIVDTVDSYQFLKLSIDSLLIISRNYTLELNELYNENSNYRLKTFFASDSVNEIVLSTPTGAYDFNIDSGYEIPLKSTWKNMLDTVLLKSEPGYVLSFWMKDLNKDLIPRTIVELAIQNDNNENIHYLYTDIFKIVQYVNQEGWGIIEIELPAINEECNLTVNVKNRLVLNEKLHYTNLIIRPKGTDVMLMKKGRLMYNNRIVNSVIDD